MLMNGTKVKPGSFSVLPGAYRFTTGQKNFDYGSRSTLVVRYPTDFPDISRISPQVSSSGRKAALSALRKSWKQVPEVGRRRSRSGCPNRWNNSTYKFKNGTVKWTRKGKDPVKKPKSTTYSTLHDLLGQDRPGAEGHLHVGRPHGHLHGQPHRRHGARPRRVLGRQGQGELADVGGRSPATPGGGRRLSSIVGVTQTADETVPAFDFSDFDDAVRVQDDLYRHVNGAWSARTEIPEDKPMVGAFVELRDAAEAAVRDIITTLEPGAPGSEAQKIADLYASFMDADAVEAAGADAAGRAAGGDRRPGQRRRAGRPRGPAHPAGRARALRPGGRVRPRQPRPLRDVRRAGRPRPARRGVLPPPRVRRHPRGLPHARRRLAGAGRVHRRRVAGRRGPRAGDRDRGLPLGQGPHPGPARDVQPDAAGRLRGVGARAALHAPGWRGSGCPRRRWASSSSCSRRSSPTSPPC